MRYEKDFPEGTDTQPLREFLHSFGGFCFFPHKGSLRDPQIADRMVARLKDKWYPAYKAVAEVPGKGIWYRVRIGSFKNRAAAQSTLERLKKDKIEAVLLPQ